MYIVILIDSNNNYNKFYLVKKYKCKKLIVHLLNILYKYSIIKSYVSFLRFIGKGLLQIRNFHSLFSQHHEMNT